MFPGYCPGCHCLRGQITVGVTIENQKASEERLGDDVSKRVLKICSIPRESGKSHTRSPKTTLDRLDYSRLRGGLAK